jgi:hypothetical protein
MMNTYNNILVKGRYVYGHIYYVFNQMEICIDCLKNKLNTWLEVGVTCIMDSRHRTIK